MTTITAPHHVARPVVLEAEEKNSSAQEASKLVAGELAMSEFTSERAAKRARYEATPGGEHPAGQPHQNDVLLTPPSAMPKVPQDLALTLISLLDKLGNTLNSSFTMRDIEDRYVWAAPLAARMLLENPALNPLELLDQLDPMLAQSVGGLIAAWVAPLQMELGAKRGTEAAADTDGVPSVSPSMNLLKALIAILIIADLSRASAKEDQAAQLRLNVASTKISAEQLVTAAKANVAGAVAGLTLTAGMAGAGTMKVLSGNKQERASIEKNMKSGNEHTRLSNDAQRKANALKGESEVTASHSTTKGGKVDPNDARTVERFKEAEQERIDEVHLASVQTTQHGWEHSKAQDTVAIGQAVIHGAAAASQLAVQGGFYAGSMHQQASTLAKSDADVAQNTADTERDAAAAHAEVAAKMLQILQAVARQEFDRNSAIVTARAA